MYPAKTLYEKTLKNKLDRIDAIIQRRAGEGYESAQMPEDFLIDLTTKEKLEELGYLVIYKDDATCIYWKV